MIWTTINSRSCFCWLYRASSSSAAKNIINLISVSTIWWCSCVESSLVLLEEGCLLWPVCSLGRMVLAFALLHSVLQTPNLPVIPGVSLEKAMAPHSSTLAWKIPWMEEPGRLQSMGSLRVGHDWATSLSLFTFMLWRRKWQPTPVFLPGESQGRGNLVGCQTSMGSHRVRHDWSNLAAAAARCFLTSYFCIPVPYNEKDIFFP